MELELVIRTCDGLERSFPLRANRTVIGREMRCDLRVPIPSVAEQHCEIVVTDGVYRLADLGSETGTFRNGDRVSEVVELKDADLVRIGPVTFHVVRCGSPNGEV